MKLFHPHLGWRSLLLLLLVALLPLRGALGASMACSMLHPTGTAVAAMDESMAAMPDMADMPGMQSMSHMHEEAHASTPPAHGEEKSASGCDASSACPLCALACAVTPMIDSRAAALALVATPASPATDTPALVAAHLTDGPERPPRSA